MEITEEKAGFSASVKNGIIAIESSYGKWRLERPAELEVLWEDIARKNGEIPYWVELWPSSLALADWLLRNKDDIRSRMCLDIGCGLGFTAMLGAALGGRVTAIDYSRDAIFWSRKNAGENGISGLNCICADWLNPPFRAAWAEYLWGADIIYEKSFYKPVLNFFERCVAPGGRIWLAEPGRAIYYGFLREARVAGWHYRPVYTAKAKSLYRDEPCKSVRIWEFIK